MPTKVITDHCGSKVEMPFSHLPLTYLACLPFKKNGMDIRGIRMGHRVSCYDCSFLAKEAALMPVPVRPILLLSISLYSLPCPFPVFFCTFYILSCLYFESQLCDLEKFT